MTCSGSRHISTYFRLRLVILFDMSIDIMPSAVASIVARRRESACSSSLLESFSALTSRIIAVNTVPSPVPYLEIEASAGNSVPSFRRAKNLERSFMYLDDTRPRAKSCTCFAWASVNRAGMRTSRGLPRISSGR